MIPNEQMQDELAEAREHGKKAIDAVLAREDHTTGFEHFSQDFQDCFKKNEEVQGHFMGMVLILLPALSTYKTVRPELFVKEHDDSSLTNLAANIAYMMCQQYQKDHSASVSDSVIAVADGIKVVGSHSQLQRNMSAALRAQVYIARCHDQLDLTLNEILLEQAEPLSVALSEKLQASGSEPSVFIANNKPLIQALRYLCPEVLYYEGVGFGDHQITASDFDLDTNPEDNYFVVDSAGEMVITDNAKIKKAMDSLESTDSKMTSHLKDFLIFKAIKQHHEQVRKTVATDPQPQHAFLKFVDFSCGDKPRQKLSSSEVTQNNLSRLQQALQEFRTFVLRWLNAPWKAKKGYRARELSSSMPMLQNTCAHDARQQRLAKRVDELGALPRMGRVQ